MENKCDKCRNCFADCSSDPIFITEEEAEKYGVPTDLVVSCDCFEAIDDDFSEEEDDIETEDVEEWDEDLLDDSTDDEPDEDLSPSRRD